MNTTLRRAIEETGRPLFGGWVVTGSPVAAEIMAGSGLDWLLIDMEHAPNGIESVLAQLYAVSAYPAAAVVRIPAFDAVVIKQVLDLGARTILVPMISDADQARAVASAAQYPPIGTRGVGSALARSARWNRVETYLQRAADHVSVFVQIESAEGVANAEAIAATPGIDGVFVGPSDLAASMGLLGQQNHPDVVAAVIDTFAKVVSTGKPCGVNAFDPDGADAYVRHGAHFLLVGADAALIARGSEALAGRYIDSSAHSTRTSY